MSTWAYTPRSHPRALFFSMTLALLFVFVFSVPAFAAELVVNDDAGCSDTTGSPSYCHIQPAIDAASSGDIIKVYPGNYSETAANKTIYNGTTYQFGLFINKNNLLIQGVDASGVAITNAAATVANVTTNATNNFGPSGIWVEGNSVTLAGLNIGPNSAGENKTFEILGDNFALKNSRVAVSGGGSIYFNDERFDTATNTSYLKSYTVEGNLIENGTSIDLTNGAGFSGPVSGRQIKNNKFVVDAGVYWPVISFNGSGTGVEWFVHSVGGAIVTGNQFVGGEQLIRARGTYDNSQFDWQSYWNDNTFERGVVTLAGASLPGFDVRSYAYISGSYNFQNVRRIGALVQPEVNNAAAGDTVLLKNGTYAETLDIFKSLTLAGESQAGVIIDTSASGDYGIDARDETAALNFVFRNFTLKGPLAAPKGNYGLKVAGDNVSVTIENVTVKNSGKTGVDLNGVNGTLLRNVTAMNNGAAGIALTNATNVTLENLTTSGNPWGGLGIFTGSYYTKGTANIVLQGTNSFGEANPIYIEPTGDGVIKGLTISGYTHVVQNSAKANHFFLQPNAAAAAVYVNLLAAAFPGSMSTVSSYLPGVTYVASNATLQTVIDAASPGETLLLSPGLYTQDIAINKHLKLMGAGSGSNAATNTILRRTAAGAAVSIAGSGESNSNPILFKNLRIEPTGDYGINLGNTQYLRLENVQVVGSPGNAIENEVCLKVATTVTVSDLTVVDSGFSNCDHGWYFAKDGDWGPNGSNVRNVYVANTSFVDNGYKGMYIEKLTDATFVNVVVTGNGSQSNWNEVWNGGIDVNLKGQEQYKNLTFQNLYVANNGLGFMHGAGLMIKARSDGTTYGAHPATLTNVTIEGGVFTGNERGIRLGEPDKNNAGPTNVQIHNASIYANNKTYAGTDGSLYGGVINYSQATVDAINNWWGAANGPSGAGSGSGDAVRQAPGTVLFDPFLVTSPLAALLVPSTAVDLMTGATSFTLPVNVNPAAGNFSSVAFSLDYDTACLRIDPTDTNGDGIPEALSGMPDGFVNSVMLDTADTDGELDVAIWDVTPPLATLPGGAILKIKFDILPACQGPADKTTFVKFSTAPSATFSDANGNAVYRATQSADPLLLDYNQAPSDILLTPGTVAENALTGAEAGTLTVTDPDGDAAVFSLVAGCAVGGDADNIAFTIAGNKLVTAVSFNFEAGSIKKVCVQANDGQGGTFVKGLTVTITDVNEPATDLTLSNTKVAEGAPIGTEVGTFSTSGDPDTGQTASYSLVAGDGSADNSKFTIAGNALQTAATVDYDTQSVYYIRVRSQDNGTPVQGIEKQFVINVLDHSLLSIADKFVVRHGQTIGIPVVFTANGNTPTFASFKLGYNAACLTYVSTANGTGTAAAGVVTVNTNGPFSNGNPLVTINFSANLSCQSGTSVALDLYDEAMTGASGSLPVSVSDGKVLVISNSARGDCNSDGFVNAGDFSAIVLETFDEDTPWWLDAPKPSYPGSPVGCDANASEYIDVADVVCTVLVVFGNSSCTGGTLMAAAAVEPAALTIAPAVNGQAVEVPVTLDGKGGTIAGAAFTLTYNPQQAALDMADADGDGLPDAVVFATGSSLKRSVSVDAAAGTIKIAVYGLSLPLPTIADGLVATVRLQAVGDAPLSGLGLTGAALGNSTGSNTPVDVEVGGVGALRSLYLPALSR